MACKVTIPSINRTFLGHGWVPDSGPKNIVDLQQQKSLNLSPGSNSSTDGRASFQLRDGLRRLIGGVQEELKPNKESCRGSRVVKVSDRG
ncbi:hypothetical protein TNCV_3470601 [Trichonephila clavipes]|nr:hypothetical protein TNCV_3470601 [Trichonephila clavipes]